MTTTTKKAKAATKPVAARRTASKAAAPAEEWLTPTQISKEEGMPPHTVQLLYGYVRTSKLEAKRIEGSKGQVVPAEKARELLANRGSRGGSRGPRPSVAKPTGKLPAGTIISHEGERQIGAGEGGKIPAGKRRVLAVTHHVGKLTYTHDGHKDGFWQTESLAKRIKDGTTQIESPANLLAVVAYQWRLEGEEGLALQLMDWCSGRVNEAGLAFSRLLDLKAEQLEQDEEEDDGQD